MLTASGYTLAGGDLDSPSGQPVNLSLLVEAADPVAQQLANDVVSACAAIGVAVTVVQTGAPGSDLLEAATAPSLPAKWQMAVELRQVPKFPSEIASRYTSGGGANQDGYSNATMDALLAQMATAPPARLPALYGEVDDAGVERLRRPAARPVARSGGRELEVAQFDRRPLFRRHRLERGGLGVPGIVTGST